VIRHCRGGKNPESDFGSEKDNCGSILACTHGAPIVLRELCEMSLRPSRLKALKADRKARKGIAKGAKK
jgi:hypothetical protein